MATEKQGVLVTLRVTEEVLSIIEKRATAMQKRVPLGVLITTAEVVRAAMLFGLNNDAMWK